jgi:hypothetical protein
VDDDVSPIMYYLKRTFMLKNANAMESIVTTVYVD